MTAYVGIDLHRRRSVAVCINEDGERLWWRRWYWAADVIAEAGGRVHLAHPLGSKAFENRRVKNDLKDATWLADLLRMGRLPEAWIPPGSVRQLVGDVGEPSMPAPLGWSLKPTPHGSSAERTARPLRKSRGRDTALATPAISMPWRPG